MQAQQKGVLIAAVGITALSPDSLILRLMTVDLWTILFYRGILTSVGLCGLIYWFSGADLPKKYRQLGRPGLLVACVFSTSTLAFVYAILHTSVAHALVIITTSSIFAAIFSRLILKEKTAIVTWVTIIIVLVAMIFIVQEKTGNATITGNLAALTSAMCIALSFVLNRKFHHIDMLPALSISGLILATASVIFATQLAVDAYNLLLLLLVSALVTIAYASFAISPKYITAAEVSLFMPLETIIGILLVWAVLGEAPSYLALIAGSIILITLLAHSVYQLRSAKIRTM